LHGQDAGIARVTYDAIGTTGDQLVVLPDGQRSSEEGTHLLVASPSQQGPEQHQYESDHGQRCEPEILPTIAFLRQDRQYGSCVACNV